MGTSLVRFFLVFFLVFKLKLFSLAFWDFWVICLHVPMAYFSLVCFFVVLSTYGFTAFSLFLLLGQILASVAC